MCILSAKNFSGNNCPRNPQTARLLKKISPVDIFYFPVDSFLLANALNKQKFLPGEKSFSTLSTLSTFPQSLGLARLSVNLTIFFSGALCYTLICLKAPMLEGTYA